MKTLIDNYDPATGNAMINGLVTYIGYNLPEYVDPDIASDNDSEIVKLAKMGYTAKDLQALRKSGVI